VQVCTCTDVQVFRCASVRVRTIRRDRPLRLATAPAAFRDLKRVGRTLHPVDLEEMEECLVET